MSEPPKRQSGLYRIVQNVSGRVNQELTRCPALGPTGMRCILMVNHQLMTEKLVKHLDDSGNEW